MQCCEGIWFPDNEVHLVKMLRHSTRVHGKGTYQYQKLTAALQYVKQRRCALDIGMHVGLWAMHLTRAFKSVVGFEPVAEHIKCLQINMAEANNWTVHRCALGNRQASVGLRFLEGSTGSTQVSDDGNEVELKRLDDFSFEAVDFLKIDVEGYEYFVVQGGEETIRKHKPVVILEQKPMTNTNKLSYGKKQYAARDLLRSWGARELFNMNDDCCLAW